MTPQQKKDIEKIPLDNLDREKVEKIFEKFSPAQRAEWYIKMRMTYIGKNFNVMARNHHVSAYAISGQVTGKQKWTKKIVAILEAELGESITNWIPAGK